MEESVEYKALKERMRAGWRQIRKAARKSRPLDAAQVRAFCADARQMTTYPGKGDEYYPAFLDLVERLEKAQETGNTAALADAAAKMRRMEKACHKRYR